MLVEADQLTKRYGPFTALEGCSLAVRQGEVFGLLGPNGAGKTTFLRLLLGFIHPTSGTARVAGHDCILESLAVRAATTYLPGEARLFRRMTGHLVLDFFSKLRRECRRDEATRIARRLDLDCSRQVARMSTGMRQKLALAVVLDLVREAQAAGRTVMFSSHVLSEVEATCDRVVILRAGRVVHEQSVAQLRRHHRITARLEGALGEVPAELREHVTVTRDRDGRIVLETADSLRPLLGWLSTLPLGEIRVDPVGLDAVYNRFHRHG